MHLPSQQRFQKIKDRSCARGRWDSKRSRRCNPTNLPVYARFFQGKREVKLGVGRGRSYSGMQPVQVRRLDAEAFCKANMISERAVHGSGLRCGCRASTNTKAADLGGPVAGSLGRCTHLVLRGRIVALLRSLPGKVLDKHADRLRDFDLATATERRQRCQFYAAAIEQRHLSSQQCQRSTVHAERSMFGNHAREG